MLTYLYRLFHEDELLYVGITLNIDQRLAAHRTQKTWWNDVTRVGLEMHDSRESADHAETVAIQTENPRYNEAPKVLKARHPATPTRPASYQPLPASEIEHLRGLTTPAETYERCAELQQAGWSVTAMLEGAKVAPTATQLRTELKYIHNPNTGVPVPVPPLHARAEAEQQRRQRKAAKPHLTADEKKEIADLSALANQRRAHHNPGHPLWEASELYKARIRAHRGNDISTREIADAAGVDESNIRRRLKEV